MKPKRTPPCATKPTPALLLACALSLSACATPNAPALPPRLPARPSLTEPMPPTPYSQSVQQLLQKWAERLTPTPATR